MLSRVCQQADSTKCTSQNDFFVEILDVDDVEPVPNENDTSAIVANGPAGTGIALTPAISFWDPDSTHFYYTIEGISTSDSEQGGIRFPPPLFHQG